MTMNPLLLGTLRWLTAVSCLGPADRDDRDDRGDVPGWVLVTVMTVGLVLGIWSIAEDELGQMLRAALSSVR